MFSLLQLFKDFALREDLADSSFIVGGAVRDLLLGRDLKDMDVAIKGDALVIARRFAERINGSFVLLDHQFGIARVVKDSQFIDLCNMRGDSIYTDLADRDLTINAMAIPLRDFQPLSIARDMPPPHPALVEGRSGADADFLTIEASQFLIDPHNGKKDLRYGIIRMVSEDNFIRDPLRLLRVYRFSSNFNFSIEIMTSSAVRKLAPLISTVAAERVMEELRHILSVKFSRKTIRELEEVGLLFHLFPEIKDIPTAAWHFTLRSFDYAEHILNNLSLYFFEDAQLVSSYFMSQYKTVCLKLSLLFPSEFIAEKIAARLKMSHKEISLIHMILANHGRLDAIDEADTATVIPLLKELGDKLYPLVIFAIARRLVCQLTEHPALARCRGLLATYHKQMLPRMSMLPIITGDDLIKEFHLTPSPLFKKILSQVEDMFLEGVIGSREEALKEASRFLNTHWH
ncbi:MAG: hypothetical protein ACLPX5_02090 [Dissulfurispiraceae bacterium]